MSHPAAPAETETELQLELQNMEIAPEHRGVSELRIHTPRGIIRGCLHPTHGAARGVIMVGGAGGGVLGPASIYPVLAEDLRRHQIAALRLDYRFPNYLEECILDTIAGVEALATLGIERIALIGWSFGGAVVISAGAMSDRVVAVATVASQSYGTELVEALAPRSLLLLHGTGDRTLPLACSEDIYRRAREPRELLTFPGANHGLDQARDEMQEKLRQWLLPALEKPAGENIP